MNDYIAKPVDERLLYSKIVGLVKKPILVKQNNEIVNRNDFNMTGTNSPFNKSKEIKTAE